MFGIAVFKLNVSAGHTIALFKLVALAYASPLAIVTEKSVKNSSSFVLHTYVVQSGTIVPFVPSNFTYATLF